MHKQNKTVLGQTVEVSEHDSQITKHFPLSLNPVLMPGTSSYLSLKAGPVVPRQSSKSLSLHFPSNLSSNRLKRCKVVPLLPLARQESRVSAQLEAVDLDLNPRRVQKQLLICWVCRQRVVCSSKIQLKPKQ